jgi:hypothetical protein
MGEDLDYGRMTFGQLEQRISAGDENAAAYFQESFGPIVKKVTASLESLPKFHLEPLQPMQLPDLHAMQRDLEEQVARRNREKAEREREAIERERAMVGYLATMKRAMESADERAAAAEQHEAERRKVADRREWAMAGMTAVSVLAAVLAIFLH